jgi:uncharacterized protein (TIGR02145 family)
MTQFTQLKSSKTNLILLKKIFRFHFQFILYILTFQIASAQNVGIGTNSPDSSAKLEVASTNMGFLPPRMTCAQRNAIVNPAVGLIIYCTDCASGEMQCFNGTNWMNMIFGIGSNAAGNLPNFTTSCGQTWTTQNLSVSRYRNGDLIPQVTDDIEWGTLTTGAWCWYNNDSVNYSQYGKLYNWYAVNDPRGLAPAGWHVPSDAEWNKLVKCIDPAADTTITQGYQNTTAGGAMKEAGTIHWSSPNNGATNSSGFAGLPAGLRVENGDFTLIGDFGLWWSSTELDAGFAGSRILNYFGADVLFSNDFKVNGFSVRLVRD